MDRLDGVAPPPLDVVAGCHLVHALLAAYESAAAGSPVDVPAGRSEGEREEPSTR